MKNNHDRNRVEKEAPQDRPILEQDFYCIWCGEDFNIFDYFMKDITIDHGAYIHKTCLFIFNRDYGGARANA